MAPPPEVTVRVPGLLRRFTDGERGVAVAAGSVAAAVEALIDRYPALGPHLHDGSGALRPHLKLFHDGVEVDEDAADGVTLEAGDEVVVLQAVSGGSWRNPYGDVGRTPPVHGRDR